jgi:hypothetical protein
MEDHICNINCFDNYESRIIDRIERKLELYRLRDVTLRGRTADTASAYKLLRKSKGHCAICSKQLVLHDWSAYHPKQFSFDRIDDSQSHHEGNLQITCYECNIYKAAIMYKKPITHFDRRDQCIIVQKKGFSDELLDV